MQLLTGGKKFHINHSTLIGWSRMLKKDLAERSIVPMEKFTDIASCMVNFQEKIAALTSEIRETKAEVAYLRKENADLREHQEVGGASSSVDAAEPEKKCLQNANDVLKDGQMRAA
eukprot:13806227-Ditylum_brightwellii.AAC.1